MKKVFPLFLFVFVILYQSQQLFAQIGINTTSPAASSALDIQASDKGVLIPRIRTAARLLMTNMANSLLVYDSDLEMFFYYQSTDNTWYALNAMKSTIKNDNGVEVTKSSIQGNVGFGTVTPQSTIDAIGTIRATDSISGKRIYGEGTVPAGTIVMWSGTIATIPSGWALCNGSSASIPNLSGKFIVGYNSANPEYQTPGNQGGEDRHILKISELPPHQFTGNTDVDGYHQHKVVVGESKRVSSSNNNGATVGFSNGDAAGDDVIATTGVRNGMGFGNNDLAQTFVMNFGTDPAVDDHTIAMHQHHYTTPIMGSGVAFENRPAYYVLAYIIKLPY